MRKRLVRRALGAAGVMTMAGMALVATPAGADTVASFNFPSANCVAESITLSAGSIFGYSGGQSPGVGSSSYSIRGFCPEAGYSQGQIVYANDPIVATGSPQRGINLDNPAVIDPAAPAASTQVYALPTYSGPATEALPGRSDVPNGLPEDADRATQWSQYTYDLQMVYNRVLQDLGNPTWNPANPYPYWNAHQAAARMEAAADQANWAFSQMVPDQVQANVNMTCYWWSGCYDPRWNGLARLRKTPVGTPTSNWYWMNNWFWTGGYINGNIGSSWTPYGWNAGPVGTGGALEGCVHSDTGTATGSADSTMTRQTWDGTTSFGCGIAVGDGQNAVVLLSGISADVKVDWVAALAGT